MKARHLGLGVALAATLLAVWQTGVEDTASTALVEPSPRRAASASPSVEQAASAPRAAPAERFVLAGADLFPAQSWQPPPAPPAPPVAASPPPPPQAPPLQYRYLGRWQEGDVVTVFLARGEQLLSARGGEQLGDWRLDDVRDDRLVFTYLPLQQQRQLRISP